MRKFYILLFLLLLGAGFMASCYEDKGSYDYESVPEVTIQGNAGGFRDTTIKRGQHLKVEPVLNMTVKTEDGTVNAVEFQPERFAFKWTAYQKFIRDSTVLGTSLNLDTVINLALANEPYKIVFSVVSKETGVTWYFTFNLKVENRYENAWLFLTEDDRQQADLTIYGKEVGNASDNPYVYEYNVLERSGFPYRGKGAKFVYYKKETSMIYIGTGESTGWIDKNQFAWNDKQLVRFQMATTPPVDFTFEGVARVGVWHFIASNGDIYPMTTDGVIMSAYNILPPGVTGTGKYETVRLAPFIGGAGGSFKCIVFDETNQRMLSYNASGANPDLNAKLLSGVSRLTNHKLYFMQGYVPDNVYVLVIAKNLQDNKYYKYIYYNQALLENETKEIVNGSLLDEADGALDRTHQYVCDYKKGNFYMAWGDKLYVLKGSENPVLQEVTLLDPDHKIEGGFNGFDPICLLTRYTDIESTKGYIMMATYATGTEKSGKVYFLEPNAVAPWELTVKAYHSNMDRVKGISRF